MQQGLPCDHVWGPYTRPIPAVACIPPVYYYSCIRCDQPLCSEIEVPVQRKCTHEMTKVGSVGLNYEAHKCTKCVDLSVNNNGFCLFLKRRVLFILKKNV